MRVAGRPVRAVEVVDEPHIALEHAPRIIVACAGVALSQLARALVHESFFPCRS